MTTNLGWSMVGLLLVIGVGTTMFDKRSNAVAHAPDHRPSTAASLEESSQKPAQDQETKEPSGQRFPVVINKPPPAPRVRVATDPETGKGIFVRCQTCHATKKPSPQTDGAHLPALFHQALKFQHGGLACLACHDRHDYDRLHLADGKPVAYADVMTLCAQCHSKRHTDYQHGAHGGMNGYWDLSRGGRTRKHCVDCHNPHWPQFPRMRPTFKPIDRFLTPPRRGAIAPGHGPK